MKTTTHPWDRGHDPVQRETLRRRPGQRTTVTATVRRQRYPGQVQRQGQDQVQVQWQTRIALHDCEASSGSAMTPPLTGTGAGTVGSDRGPVHRDTQRRRPGQRTTVTADCQPPRSTEHSRGNEACLCSTARPATSGAFCRTAVSVTSRLRPPTAQKRSPSSVNTSLTYAQTDPAA